MMLRLENEDHDKPENDEHQEQNAFPPACIPLIPSYNTTLVPADITLGDTSTHG